MAEVGDTIAVAAAKGAPSRRGLVIAKTGSKLTARWDDGHESSFVPAPGSVAVESGAGADT